MMITMQAPKRLTEFRLEGKKIELRDGFVVIDERHLETFCAHGFARRSAQPAPPAQSRDARADKEQTP